MTGIRARRRSRIAPVAGLVVAGVAGLGLASGSPTLALINESPSVPRGVYVRAWAAPVTRGATIALPQPEAARPYLRSLGMPDDVRLLKRVAAMSGDPVCRTGDRLQVAGRVVFLRSTDRRGVPLSQWRECRRLARDEVFVLGDTPGSFDSRYFGPVRLGELEGVFLGTLQW